MLELKERLGCAREPAEVPAARPRWCRQRQAGVPAGGVRRLPPSLNVHRIRLRVYMYRSSGASGAGYGGAAGG